LAEWLRAMGYSERLACEVVGLERSTDYNIKFRMPTTARSVARC